MAACYSGNLAGAEKAIAPIRALRDPILDLLHQQPYQQLQSYLDDTEPKGSHYYWRTEYVAELSDGLLSAVPDVFSGCPIPGGEIGFLHLAGALNEHAENDGAVGNRDARFVTGVKGMWETGDPDAASFRQWIRRAGARVRPFSTGRSYINFQTADEDERRIRATYGANFERLTKVKKAYDPDNVFRANRNITPAA
jgi:FAD/FMN-containing dehydrogenase